MLRIATLDLEVPVYDGVTEWNVNRGAARIEGTATFDERSNVGLAAHRDGYFRALQYIRKGDLVEVLTINERLQYRVTDIRIVSPQAVEVLAPTQAPALTLVTCPIEVRYENFSLSGIEGVTYHPLPPIDIKGTVTRIGRYPVVA